MLHNILENFREFSSFVWFLRNKEKISKANIQGFRFAINVYNQFKLLKIKGSGLETWGTCRILMT